MFYLSLTKDPYNNNAIINIYKIYKKLNKNWNIHFFDWLQRMLVEYFKIDNINKTSPLIPEIFQSLWDKLQNVS